MTPVWLVDSHSEQRELVEQLRGVWRVAIDIESNGMFAYRPRVCTIQLAWCDAHRDRHVAIVDTFACGLDAMNDLLSNPSVLKIVHDLSFDARALHAEGIRLACLRDTAVAATYLGKPATGLASLLAGELGVHVSKNMQNSDWAARPLSDTSIAYLAGDVAHLDQLETLLWQQVQQAHIEDEVSTETAYRLSQALSAPVNQPPSAQRLRGYHRLDGLARRVASLIVPIREQFAIERNLPPQRVLADPVMIAIAMRRPRSLGALSRFGQTRHLSHSERQDLLDGIIEAIKLGPLEEEPASDSHHHNPHTDSERKLEKTLMAWRKRQASARGVNEQVVLPSHCLKHLVGRYAAGPGTDNMLRVDQLAAIPGLGTSRTKRYGAILVQLVNSYPRP